MALLALLAWGSVCRPSHPAYGDDPPVPPPAKTTDNDATVLDTPLSADDFEHWAFRPVARPDLPEVAIRDWALEPVDRFIQARHERAGATAAPRASDDDLLRRITFDLTGLPPTVGDIEAFQDEIGPDRVARLADRLLAAPAHGEHAARFWLDLARFAETDGFEHDLPRPQAWRYRDWVIDAWNADLPFDRFARLQIAGDILAPDDPAALIATGFLLAGPDMPDLNLPEERRHVVLNELTGAVGSVFLGLQLGCAECHDHKTDPLSQADFYRLRAYFDSLDLFRDVPLPGRGADETARAVQRGEPRPSHVYLRGDFRRPGPVVRPAVPRIADPPQPTSQAEQVRTQRADENANPGEPPADPRVALAHWLTTPERPLFARVAVNRLWQEHFGAGLVETSSELGLLGDLPSHPELLDWLADDWPRQGWSAKRLRRDLILSATYQQASSRQPTRNVPSNAGSNAGNNAGSNTNDSAARPSDPTNRLLTRQNRRRLTGEAIRDALLAVSGTLDRSPGGPGVRPPLPPEVVATLLKKQWDVSPRPRDHHRRSVYVFVRRNLPFPIFAAFDRPDRNASCPVRGNSTTAPQSLVLWNSDFAVSSAQSLAALVLSIEAADDDRLRLLFQRCLSRTPTEAERAESLGWLAERAAGYRVSRRGADELGLSDPRLRTVDAARAAAWVDLCRTMLNLNEFVYID